MWSRREFITSYWRYKNKLQDIRNKKLEGMMIKSRAKWLQDGKKVISYFCNLESRKYTSKSMAFLKRYDGKTVFDQKDILEEVNTIFYETLYTTGISERNFAWHANTFIRGQRAYWGFTYICRITRRPKKNIKNNKSPGPDGFSVEFYK